MPSFLSPFFRTETFTSADVNVSVRKKGDKKLGTRCEIKNVNSIKFMQMAIDFEANRQVDVIEEGGSIDHDQ